MAKNILVIGAGRSATCLINYLLANSTQEGWTVTVADVSIALIESKTKGHSNAQPIEIDITKRANRRALIQAADMVVSMLPANMHHLVAKDCIEFKKNMVNASYLSEEMQKLNKKAIEAGITILTECGLDPGIDHLSAMKIIDEIKGEGHTVREFESFTGGLVAPESDNNPWGYKFTWNPRNVVLAGQGGAVKFIQEGTYKYIPYHKLFRRTEIIDIEGYGKFEGYANRDSLAYREVYGLEDVKTMYRGTLRRPGFCRAWNCFVQLGATDDSYTIADSENMTHRDFINLFLAYNPHDSVELKLRQYLKIDQDMVELWDKLVWLGIFEDTKIGLKNATPAQILQHILEKKWSLEPTDKDMIVMWHKFTYDEGSTRHVINSSMVVKGEDQTITAMAKTVGYPLGIAVKLMMQGKISTKGVIRPVTPNIYLPILQELETMGITFAESVYKIAL